MKLYHGTDVDVKTILSEGLIPQNEDYLGMNRWGVFFTEDEYTAEKYGCNIFAIEIDADNENLTKDETEVESWIYANYVDANDLELISTRKRELSEAELEKKEEEERLRQLAKEEGF